VFETSEPSIATKILLYAIRLKFIEPVLPEIENTFREYQFINIDTDKNMHIARSLNIFGIPSFVVYDSGKEIDRLVNKDRKTKNEIISFIDQAIER